MFGRALLLFVLVPLIELVLLNQLVQRTSLTTTILVVLATGVVGVSLTRRQGLRAWRGIHEQMSKGKSPSREILDGVMILFAGAFLITPGLLTDCVGFSLLIPYVRSVLGRMLTRWFKERTVTTFQATASWTATDFPTDAAPEEEGPSVRVVEPKPDSGGQET